MEKIRAVEASVISSRPYLFMLQFKVADDVESIKVDRAVGTANQQIQAELVGFVVFALMKLTMLRPKSV